MIRKIKKFFAKIDYRSLLFALLGSAIVAFGTYNIHAYFDIPEGGIIGLCLIIENFFGVSPAVSNLVINALCYLLAWRLMGTKYILNAGVATVGFSAFYALFAEFPPIVIPVISNYPLLMALIGAIFIEVGNGISIRFGSAPTGEHTLSLALSGRGGIDFGWFSFIFDATIILLAYSYADPFTVVYALLIMTVTNPIMDYIVSTPKRVKQGRAMVRPKRSPKSYVPIVLTGIAATGLMMGITLYLNYYVPADDVAIRAYEVENVKEVALGENTIAYVPEGDIKAGFIFYPGSKIDPKAYAPLLKECADNGIVAVVVKMPYSLSIFGINEAIAIPPGLPHIDTWYIGGHSLGGCMAANCASNNPDIFDGVVLLGAYSTTDISSYRVLSVYGSSDGILNKRKYSKYMDNLPENFEEHIIIGGNHAYFGMYGDQDGDGIATITNEKQIELTAEYIVDFILGKD